MSGRYRSTGPAAEPVLLTTLKAFLRIGASDTGSDTLLNNLIPAAREAFEGLAARSLITQTWKLYLDDWPGGSTDQPHPDRILLPYPPVASVTSIAYTDSGGNAGTITTGYTLSKYPQDRPGQIVLNSSVNWPAAVLQSVDGLVITYATGFGAADTSVPLDIQTIICQIVKFWFDGDPTMDLPPQLLTAINRHKAEWF